MLVILLFLFAANGFVTTGADSSSENVEGIVYTSKVVFLEEGPAVPESSPSYVPPPLETVTESPPIYSTPTCNDNNSTLVCNDNEILDKCPSYCPSDYCPTGDKQNQRCSTPNPCPPPACKCRFNYRRAQNGTCIPTRDCPAFECPNPNEVYNSCPPYCPTDSCTQASPSGRCPPALGRIGVILECRPSCRCQKGFWRVSNGTCVPYEQCPGRLNCGPNEVIDDCPTDCKSDYCPTSDEPEQSCAKPCQCPPPACKCAFNFRRSANGTCIPTRECPPYKCDKLNEEYNPCPPFCPSDDCSQATPDGKCPLPGRIGILLECFPKCRCKKNFWRKDGVCVPYDECPGKLGCAPGEVEDNCPVLCNTDYCPKNEYDIRTCYTPIKCMKPACRCPFNHLRAENGTCIPASSCPPIKCTRPYESYNSCPPACPSDDCSQATPSGECPIKGNIGIAVECKPGCRCDKFYFRQNGTCVPFGQCGLDCSGPHEFYACGGACDNVCETLHIQSQDNCPIINIKCNDMCYCEKGYARDDKGICIPISKCPKRPCDKTCPRNEVYTDCKKKCPSDRCSSVLERCIPSETCSPGCVCASGYLRKKDRGPCIPMCECPQLKNTDKCKKPSEIET